MPTIAQAEHDKSLLRLVFAAAGISNIDIKACRLERGDLFSNQEAWEDAVARKDPETPIPVADFYEGERHDNLPRNYLYLVPTRPLLKDEWQRFLPLMTLAWKEKGLNFASSISITHENGSCESVPDASEDGGIRKPVVIFKFTI